jgi:catechol 2,3-dioxygenase-like lactoylglutathione lyase family enzyme
MTDKDNPSASAFASIKAIDYSVIFVRDMVAMQRFYQDVLGFDLTRELSPNWVEFRVGPNTLALARPGHTRMDPPTPNGSAALQLAFRVSPSQVDQCALELAAKGVAVLAPPTDHAFGHRTLFFRDPDGNLLEIYAEI